MKSFLLLVWLVVPHTVLGRPAPDDVYKIQVSVTQCTVREAGAEYTGFCQDTAKPGYVVLSSDACATISQSKCLVEAPRCRNFGHLQCINADNMDQCQANDGSFPTSGQCPQGLVCCEGIARQPSSQGDLRSQLPDDFLDQLSPGAGNQFLSPEGGDIALLSGSDPSWQPFADLSPSGMTTFDIAPDVDLTAFQLDTSPTDFSNQYLAGSLITPFSNNDENQQQFEASNSDFSLFYPA